MSQDSLLQPRLHWINHQGSSIHHEILIINISLTAALYLFIRNIIPNQFDKVAALQTNNIWRDKSPVFYRTFAMKKFKQLPFCFSSSFWFWELYSNYLLSQQRKDQSFFSFKSEY